MVDPKIEVAIKVSLHSFSKYSSFDAVALIPTLNNVFASDESFMDKVGLLDGVFDNNPQLEELREVFFDLLMINFFSEDVKKLEDDYLETPEWEQIEEQTLDRGTELLNLLLYLNECEDEDIEPGLDDYLKEFLLVDEDEFQDEYRIYEPVIAHQVLMESPVEEINKVAAKLPEDSELKEIFYPMMCFFKNTIPTEQEKNNIAEKAVNKQFDMSVFSILEAFN